MSSKGAAIHILRPPFFPVPLLNTSVVHLAMRFVSVIPARFDSSRLPGKPLLEVAGKPLIRWVYERAREALRVDEVMVATDDGRVQESVLSFGGTAVMTSRDHRSGTDRVAEVAREIEADVFVNIQADQPLISPATIDQVCTPFEEDGQIQVTTARVEITDPASIESPHVVKVVVDGRERALYFSRSVIPYPRRESGKYYKHIGIYAYRRELLLNLERLKPSELEEVESLEQLRWLENGIPIEVVEVYEDSQGVDIYDDIERVRPLLENEPVQPENS